MPHPEQIHIVYNKFWHGRPYAEAAPHLDATVSIWATKKIGLKFKFWPINGALIPTDKPKIVTFSGDTSAHSEELQKHLGPDFQVFPMTTISIFFRFLHDTKPRYFKNT